MRRRPWPGYADPALPEGMWWSWVQATGDVSGGDMTLIIELEPAELQLTLSGNYYSVEQLEVHSSVNGNTDGLLSIINFGGLIGGATANRHRTLPYDSNEGGVGAVNANAGLLKPWFIGAPTLASVTSSVRFTQDNVDAEVVIFRAEGYIWGARSTQAPGGVRRPMDSPYG